MKKAIVIFLLLIDVCLHSFAQDTAHALRSPLDKGIYFGSPNRFSGVRFNLLDRAEVNYINGLSFSLLASQVKKQNGLSFSGVSADSLVNGVRIGILACNGRVSNGVAVAGLFGNMQKVQGIGLAGLTFGGDTLVGLFVALWGIAKWDPAQSQSIKLIKGIAIGPMGTSADLVK